MFKKYTIIALGALMIAGQANGMGSWARKLWAPSAVAAASVFTAKTNLCPSAKLTQYPDGTYQYDPNALREACKKCRVPVLSDNLDNRVEDFTGRGPAEGLLKQIGHLEAGVRGTARGYSPVDYQELLLGAPCVFNELVTKEDADKLTKEFIATEKYENQFTMNGDLVSLKRQYSDAQKDPRILSRLLQLQINFLERSPLNLFNPERTGELLSYTKCLQKTFNDNPNGANIDGTRLYHTCSRGVNLGYSHDELANSVSSVLRRREKENSNK